MVATVSRTARDSRGRTRGLLHRPEIQRASEDAAIGMPIGSFQARVSHFWTRDFRHADLPGSGTYARRDSVSVVTARRLISPLRGVRLNKIGRRCTGARLRYEIEVMRWGRPEMCESYK